MSQNPKTQVSTTSDLIGETYTPIADRERRIKRLKFRANHRGMREMDILIGGFVDTYGDSMTHDELDQLEFILSIHDAELFRVLVEFAEPPAVLSVVPMLHRMLTYRDERFKTGADTPA